MIVMVEASTHTIAELWTRARFLSRGDPEDREFGAGMQEVLRQLGVAEPIGASPEGLSVSQEDPNSAGIGSAEDGETR